MINKIKSIFDYDKNKYESILDDPNSKIGIFFEKLILGLVVLFPLVMVFESLGKNYLLFREELFYFEFFISLVFAVEYIYRFLRARKKIDFFINPFRIIDLLSFLPFFLGLFSGGFMLQIIKIMRIFRIFRLLKKIPLTAGFLKALKNYKDEYLAVFTLYFVILFMGAFFVYLAEKGTINTTYQSLGDALWWGIVTTSTLGYGDMIPQTDIGRIFGSILIFLGPLLGGLISAVTIMVFMETSKILNKENNLNNHKKYCTRCKTKNPIKANYCMKCGESFEI